MIMHTDTAAEHACRTDVSFTWILTRDFQFDRKADMREGGINLWSMRDAISHGPPTILLYRKFTARNGRKATASFA